MYSGRTSANAPNNSPTTAGPVAGEGACGQSTASRPPCATRGGAPRRREAQSRTARQRLPHQHALVLDQGGVDRDCCGADQSGDWSREAATDQVGEEHRQGAEQGEHEPGGAFVDAAGRLVDPRGEQWQPGGVVARRLRGAWPQGEPVAAVEVRGDRRVGRRVEHRRPADPRLVDPQPQSKDEDGRQYSEPRPPAVPFRQAAHLGDAMALCGLSSHAASPPSASCRDLCAFSFLGATATWAGRRQ